MYINRIRQLDVMCSLELPPTTTIEPKWLGLDSIPDCVGQC